MRESFTSIPQNLLGGINRLRTGWQQIHEQTKPFDIAEYERSLQKLPARQFIEQWRNLQGVDARNKRVILTGCAIVLASLATLAVSSQFILTEDAFKVGASAFSVLGGTIMLIGMAISEKPLQRLQIVNREVERRLDS